MWAISGQVTKFILSGAGNSDHVSISNSDRMINNSNNMLSYVIRWEEHSLTAEKERSWFEQTIT